MIGRASGARARIRRGGSALALALVLLGAAAREAAAGGGAATDAYDGIAESAALDVHGFADVFVMHDFDRPASGQAQLREFDSVADLPALGYLRLTLAHAPRRVGFRIDVGAGQTADVFARQDPAVVEHPDLARGFSYVQQAFLTVVLRPGERALTLDLGRFGTPVGLENNESIDCWNYSRSLLYSFAEPTLHAGLRLTWTPLSSLGLTLFWVNGWNGVIVDASGMRAAALAATWKPRERLELALVWMGGLEHPPTQLGAPLALRNVLDAYAIWRVSDRLTFALTVDYGNDRAYGGVNWWGLGGYARLQPLPWLAGTLRGEYLADPDGFVTGRAQKVAETTATVEVQKRERGARLIARLEYRHDQSTARVFDGRVPASLTAQDTLTLALLAAF